MIRTICEVNRRAAARLERRRDEIPLDAHINEPNDANRVVRMKRLKAPRVRPTHYVASVAVSLSRISPTMITPGSWRKICRSPLTNV